MVSLLNTHRPKIVALTGGIASGKSVVSEHLQILGVPIIDTDVIARTLLAPHSPLSQQVIAHFGDEVATAPGVIDRRALRHLIASSPKAKQWLEANMHPRIQATVKESIKSLTTQDTMPYAVIVVPLLVESWSHYAALVDEVWVVEAPNEVRVSRLMSRDNLSASAAEAMLNVQASDPERRAIATHCLQNHEGIDALLKHVDQLHETLTLCRP